MSKKRYLFSPNAKLLIPPAVSSAADCKRKRYEQYAEDIHNGTELLHCDMSWGSLEDRYVPNEIPSHDSMLSPSSCSTRSFSSFSSTGRVSMSKSENSKYCINKSSWGSFGLNTQLWEDAEAPVVRIRNLEEILFNDLEFCGFLTDRLIGIGSSFLAKSPENGLYVLNKCVMNNMSLTNIAMLRYHRYLRYIDLAYNYISNLSPLGGVPYLVYLNVSHNRVKKVLNFKPPWYLTDVNLSYNYLSEMDDISNFWSIVRLDLSHNAIEAISGLQNLKYLKYLNLSYNLIECLENLDKLNIEELNLEGNCISSYKFAVPGYGISSLPQLRVLTLGYNRLSNLEFFKHSYSLRVIDLKFNKINDLLEVSNFSGLIYEIDLRGNGCTKWPNYKGVLLFSIPSIKVIDGSKVSTSEKVSAVTLFASPLNLTAARTVTKLTLLEQLSIPKIDLHVKPYDEVSPPLVVLTGPSAVKKIVLCLKIVKAFPKKVKYCQWYTTKEIEDSETERQSYIFVNREEFNDMSRRGDFLAIQDLLGHSYGLHHKEINSLVLERKIGITQMDLHATMQMSKRYSNIKTVLVLTKSEEVHRSWIREKFDVYTWIKDSVENLLVLRTGKPKEASISEPKSNESDLVEEIVDHIVDRVDLPPSNASVKPQGTEGTTKTIHESKTLPNIVITLSDAEIQEKRLITFKEKKTKDLQTKATNPFANQDHKPKGLRVIMDEDANIIIEDEASKRKRQRAKILYRRNTLELEGVELYLLEEYGESASSEETITQPYSKRISDMREPEFLKEMYTELVISSRKMYLKYHMKNPGFFSLVLLTDDHLKAVNTLINFIYEVYVNYSSQKPKFLSEINHFTQVAVPAMVNEIVDEIRE